MGKIGASHRSINTKEKLNKLKQNKKSNYGLNSQKNTKSIGLKKCIRKQVCRNDLSFCTKTHTQGFLDKCNQISCRLNPYFLE